MRDQILSILTAQVEVSDSTKCGHSKFGITVFDKYV